MKCWNLAFALENISNIKVSRNGDAPGTPVNCKPVCSLQHFRACYNDDGACPGIYGHRSHASHDISAVTDNPGVTLREEELREDRHSVKLFELQAHKCSMCVTVTGSMCVTMVHGGNKRCTMHNAQLPTTAKHCATFGANGDDNDVLKLPEGRLELELFGKVLMVPVSINELLILLGKDRDRLVSKNNLRIVHILGRKLHLDRPCVWEQYYARA